MHERPVSCACKKWKLHCEHDDETFHHLRDLIKFLEAIINFLGGLDVMFGGRFTNSLTASYKAAEKNLDSNVENVFDRDEPTTISLKKFIYFQTYITSNFCSN